MKGAAEDGGEVMSGVWDPRRHAYRPDIGLVRYSRGFLRCRPERWFPGVGPQWLPLGHALGIEIRVTGVKPVLDVPPRLEVGYAWSSDGELALLLVDDDATRVIAETIVPGASPLAQSVVLDYVARRFVASLARAWSGSESSRVQFESEVDVSTVQCVGAVKLALLLNGQACEVWIGLGRELVERLDGLWRRQLRATLRVQDEAMQTVTVSLTHSLQSAAAVRDFIERGVPLELSGVNPEALVITTERGAVQVGRLCDVDGRLAFETRGGVPPSRSVGQGQALIDVQLGRCTMDVATLVEVSQIGGTFVTDTPLTPDVEVFLSGERIATGRLGAQAGAVLLHRISVG